MRMRIHIARLTFLIILTMAATATTRYCQGASAIEQSEWNELGPEERTVVLKLLEKQIEANYEKIATWQGMYQQATKRLFRAPDSESNRSAVKLKEIDPDSRQLANNFYNRKYVSTVVTMNFQVDFKSDTIYSDVLPKTKPKVFVGNNGKRYQFLATPRTTIQTPEHSLTFRKDSAPIHLRQDPDVPGWTPFASSIVQRDPHVSANSAKIHGDVFDPRLLFGDGPLSFASELHAGAEESRINPKTETLHVFERHNTNEKIFRKTSTPTIAKTGSQFERIVTFDSSVGFNVTSVQWISLPTSRVFQDSIWTYKKDDGIFVPSSFRQRQFNVGNNELKYEKSLVLVESTLNKPLDPSQFTLQRFGLKDGDRMEDSIRGELMIRQDEKWVTSDEYIENHEASIRRKKWLNLFYIGISVLGLISLFIGVAKLKQLRLKRAISHLTKKY